MKKGLRPNSCSTPSPRAISSSACPDEEGIETSRLSTLRRDSAVRALALMKKGLRPTNSSQAVKRTEVRALALMKKGLRPGSLFVLARTQGRVRALALMKKGLRRGLGGGLGGLGGVRALALMKKGLRLLSLDFLTDLSEVRALALMKKGLRPSREVALADDVGAGSSACPDEEGIETSLPMNKSTPVGQFERLP